MGASMADSSIQLVVGLGNPGGQYERTRHNAGFWVVDRWARRLGTTFQMDKSFFGEVARTRRCGQSLWLLKPQTYMNRSGQSVGAIARFYKIAPHQILVVHDELDLLPGQLRLKKGGGHAGHNGLRDIQSVLGDAGYWRLRVGIGHPRSLGLEQGVADFVLHPPRQVEVQPLEDAMDRCDKAMAMILDGETSKAMGELHRDPLVRKVTPDT